MTTINIELVSDFVCPWCDLGRVRLRAALEQLRRSHPALRFRTNWLPFFLNPNTPSSGEPYWPFLEAKFGGRGGAEKVLARVREAAETDGLVFAFERIATRPNTLNAHRLMYRAQSLGARPEHIDALADALFDAYFRGGKDIGDLDTLADIAVACGEKRDPVLAYLTSDRDRAAVQRMADGIARQGVEGVPFFIFDRKLALSGAQSAAVIGATLLQAVQGSD